MILEPKSAPQHSWPPRSDLGPSGARGGGGIRTHDRWDPRAASLTIGPRGVMSPGESSPQGNHPPGTPPPGESSPKGILPLGHTPLGTQGNHPPGRHPAGESFPRGIIPLGHTPLGSRPPRESSPWGNIPLGNRLPRESFPLGITALGNHTPKPVLCEIELCSKSWVLKVRVSVRPGYGGLDHRSALCVRAVGSY